MNEEQVYKLLERVRVYYQNLARSDNLLDEWFKILKNYDNREINESLDNYLDSEKNRARIPIPQDLTQGLLTIEKKQKTKRDYIIRCNLCGQEMNYSEYENKHFDKCSSINYLVRVMNLKGINIERRELADLSEEKFKRVYNEYKDY